MVMLGMNWKEENENEEFASGSGRRQCQLIWSSNNSCWRFRNGMAASGNASASGLIREPWKGKKGAVDVRTDIAPAKSARGNDLGTVAVGEGNPLPEFGHVR